MKCAWVLAMASAGWIGGCAQPAPTVLPVAPALRSEAPGQVVVPVEPAIINIEGEKLTRAWPPRIAWYSSGAVPAFPVYYSTLDAETARPDWQAPFVDAGLFAWNTLTLPVYMVIQPPWTTVVYYGAEQLAPVPSAAILPQ